jgi:hypothetical protein
VACRQAGRWSAVATVLYEVEPLECTLAEALLLAREGGTVDLATPGYQHTYVGNWVVSSTTGALVTLQPAPGVTDPVLDGNKGYFARCSTEVRNGRVITVGTGAHLDLFDVTVRYGSATDGGGVANDGGGVVAISGVTFAGNIATANGGAIDNADHRVAALADQRPTLLERRAVSPQCAMVPGGSGAGRRVLGGLSRSKW